MLQKLIEWIHNNHLGYAVPITHRNKKPYPEVTGYYIPTLLALGENTLAEKFALWLVSVQNKDGSFSLDNPHISYVFDTGQVIRGWVRMINRLPMLLEPLERACHFIMSTADPMTGRFMVPKPGFDWHLENRGEVNEAIHLYVIKPMIDASRILNKPYIEVAAKKALLYYLKNCEITNFELKNSLTHFYAYIQEALFELGCFEHLQLGMNSVAKYQSENGAVPGYYDVQWICSTGLAQLAKVWYLMNEVERADRAMSFLHQIQNYSGGFYGSYGVNASYFECDEISWAVKYAIDAQQLYIASHFDKTAHHYAKTIPNSDERAKVILDEIGNSKRILDAGCGNGRYASFVKHVFKEIDIHAIDISKKMLSCIPSDIQTKCCSIQELPYPNDYFDMVYCIEALEHTPHPKSAIRELIRVISPNGKLIIIDKNIKMKGTLNIEAWEKWFDINEIKNIMEESGLSVNADYIGYDGKSADGLFIKWVGKKLSTQSNHHLENIISKEIE